MAKNFDEIMREMLSNTDNDKDVREGSIIYDSLAPTAIELVNLYIAVDDILKQTFADTADRAYLIRRASERGVVPYASSYAVVKGIAYPTDAVVDIGDRFVLNNYYYSVTGYYSDDDGNTVDGHYLLTSETAGYEQGNQTGNASAATYCEGLQYMTITECISPGSDEEDTEHFRTRYLESFTNLASGGNVAWYKEKVKAMSIDGEGVGACKVYRATNNKQEQGGYVTIRILDCDYNIPNNDTLRNYVKEQLDPEDTTGEGLGLAPIGHCVKVLYPTRVDVNVGLKLEYSEGYDWDSVYDEVEEAIGGYIKGLRAVWEDTDGGITIRSSRIINAILNQVTGVEDILKIEVDETTLSDGISVPVLGFITKLN